MAVDRGGLSYTIAVRDQFSKTTARFKSEMRDSKAAFAEFQKGAAQQKASARSFKGTTKEISEQQAALQRLAAEAKRQRDLERESVRIRNAQQRDASRAARERVAVERRASQEQERLFNEELRRLKDLAKDRKALARAAARDEANRRRAEARGIADQQRNLKAFADAQLRREREAQKLLAAQRKDQDVRRRADPNFVAQERLNKALREEAIQRSKIALLRQRGQAQIASGDLFGGVRTLRQAKDLERQVNGINKSANNLFFTFRRLVGVLALFTIARNVVQGFNDMVRAAIRFNDQIESSRTAIAGLLVAVTDVRDEFGQSVEPGQELALAMKLADDQVKLLRQDALRTVATFEQLLDTFQIAVAPGFAAGLNLDEIRKLTVSISQAASAIGVEQNQLAEEVRSLLSGTIQARTTRIATALGITNADIRRLKETGELFDFLEERFSGFALSAERQARTTLGGITTLIRGATVELLGDAARPLFKELLDLGNQFFDQVLTIVDAQGNLRPNPAVVKGFQEIFQALRLGVLEIRELASNLGFEGLQNIFKAAGEALVAGIKFALGFAETLLVTLNAVVDIVSGIADAFNLSTRELGRIAGALGVVVAATVVWNNTLGLVGLRFGVILKAAQRIGPVIALLASGPVAILAATVTAIVFGFNKVAESIFGLQFGLKNTIKLIVLGLAGAFGHVIEIVQIVAVRFKEVVSIIFTSVKNLGSNLILEARRIKEALTGNNEEAGRLSNELADQRFKQEKELAEFRKASELSVAKIRADALKGQAGIEANINKIVADAAAEQAQGPGFDPDFDPKFNKAKKDAETFAAVISSADSAIQALSETLQELDDDLFQTGEEFRILSQSPALEGIGGKIQGIFSDAAVTNAEKLRKLRASLGANEQSITDLIDEQGLSFQRVSDILSASLAPIEQRRAALEALDLQPAEAALVSALRDQLDIRNALTEVEQISLDLAVRKAAIVALQETPAILRESQALQAQLGVERTLTQAAQARVGARRQAVIEAQNAIDLARVEADLAQQQLAANIQEARNAAALADDPKEAAAFEGLVVALQERLLLEQGLSEEKLKQLEIARQEAALIESGTLGQGLNRGFQDLINDLPTAFEAGVTIVKQSVQALARFISQSIVAAFDPTAGDGEERIARFLQGIANLILEQITQLGISALLQQILGQTQAGAIEVASATTAATIKVTAATEAAAIELAAAQAAAVLRSTGGGFFGFHRGGLVQGFNKGGKVAQKGRARLAHLSASGYTAGGPPARPRGLHPADTVPAWLQAGEFVMRKRAVDNLGLGFLTALNSGNFNVAASSPPSGAGAATAAGMARGGLVSDQAQRQGARGDGQGQGEPVIVPVQTTSERNLDRMLAGGKFAARQLFNDNAGLIRQIAQGK